MSSAFPALSAATKKKNDMLRAIVITLLLTAASAAWSLPLTNPAPSILGNDIGGSGLFSPGNVSVGIEILDLGPLLTGSQASVFPANGFGGAEFGFYFANDPTTRVTIFDSLDQNPDPGGPGSVAQVALIDFLTGEVRDEDAGVQQSAFAAGSSYPIGFYLTLAQDMVNFFGLGFDTIYSESYLNPSAEDMSASFPLLDGSGFMLAFGAVNPFSATGDSLIFGASIATGITPVTVPEPGTAGLLLLGSAMLLWLRRRPRGMSA